MYNYNDRVEGMRFEWDEAKNLSNRRKHGVSFEKPARYFSIRSMFRCWTESRMGNHAGRPWAW
jgi:uncharacterized DUF497 family protein